LGQRRVPSKQSAVKLLRKNENGYTLNENGYTLYESGYTLKSLLDFGVSQ